MNASVVSVGLVFALLAACTPTNPAPPKSPTNDVEPPATTTGDGEVRGADRMSPSQKLEQGPKLDLRDGVKPAAKPPVE